MPQTEGEVTLTQAKLAQRLGTTSSSVIKRAGRRGIEPQDFLIQLASAVGETWEIAGSDGRAFFFKSVP